MTFTKKDPADLDSPRQELSNSGLESAVTLLVRWQIDFLSDRIGHPIQLYVIAMVFRPLQLHMQ